LDFSKISFRIPREYRLIFIKYNCFIEGNLEVKFPRIWINEKQSMAEVERRERSEE
jgi:hypothetical protein